jgi:hypothetical protein
MAVLGQLTPLPVPIEDSVQTVPPSLVLRTTLGLPTTTQWVASAQLTDW